MFGEFTGDDPINPAPLFRWPGGYVWELQFTAYGSYQLFAFALEQGSRRQDVQTTAKLAPDERAAQPSSFVGFDLRHRLHARAARMAAIAWYPRSATPRTPAPLAGRCSIIWSSIL